MPQNAEEGLIKGQNKRIFLILNYTFFRDQPLMFYIPTFNFSSYNCFNNYATFVTIRLVSKETKINFIILTLIFLRKFPNGIFCYYFLSIMSP